MSSGERTPRETEALVGYLAGHVGKEHGISAEDVLGTKRQRAIVRARHALYLALWHEGLSIAEVGKALSKDHTTIIYGMRRALGPEGYEKAMLERYGAASRRKRKARKNDDDER